MTFKSSFLEKYKLNSKSPKYIKMLNACEKVSKSKVNILLLGESGSGKEIAAKYIHACSNRKNKKFVAINCSSYVSSLLESELFGYEPGAFTGANKSKAGKIETSNGGTLFLDEIGDIDLPTQIKLLRVLESKSISRIGSNIENLVDFRLLSATNRNLLQAVQDKEYREDFLYRVSTIVIEVPPLRERTEDLEDLISFFLKSSQEENSITIKSISKEAHNFLYEYDYPGNIRELKSIIDRMVVLSENGVITKDGIPIIKSIKRPLIDSDDTKYESPKEKFSKIIPFKEYQRLCEKDYLIWVLEKCGWNVTKASKELQISSRQLFNKINLYNIRR